MKKITGYIIAICMLLCLSAVCFAGEIPQIYGDAEVRLENPVGIRVKAQIDAASADSEKTIEYGFLVSRKVFLDSKNLSDDELTVDCGVQYTKGVSKGVVDGVFVDSFFEKDDENVFFAAYFHGIQPRFYSEMIVCRPYIQTQDGIFYGTPYKTSLYETAKKIYADKTVFEDLDTQKKDVICSIILAVEGEPYYLDRGDLRIVLSSQLIKNENPSYSVNYRLFNPFTGEILENVKGRKKSKNISEIEAMVLPSGKIVPASDDVVQDTTEGYITADFNEFSPVWIGGCDLAGGKMSVSLYDETLTCKDCIKEYISQNHELLSVNVNTPVTVFDGILENENFTRSDMAKVSAKDKTLLCHNGEVYSDYVKAYVSVCENECEYIIVTVNGNESVSDDKCLVHTSFDVKFYSEGNIHEERKALYGTCVALPEQPEKDGYTFLGWSKTQNGEVVEADSVAITENTNFYAVFEKNPVYYEVSFIVDGEEYASYSVLENECSEVPTSPAKDGYEFLGWAESENGIIVYPGNTPANSDVVYYAVFEKLIVNCKVTFMFDGKVLCGYSVLTGEISPAPDTTPETAEGYKFIGWSLAGDNDRTSVVDISSFEIMHDTVFYSVIITNPNSAEFMEKLNRGYTELAKIKRVSGNTKKSLDLIRNTISNVLAEANNFNYIDKDYVLRVYGAQVNEAKRIITDVMTETERSQFANLVKSNVSDDVEEFLTEYFKISVDI